jgi:hypothetical protein
MNKGVQVSITEDEAMDLYWLIKNHVKQHHQTLDPEQLKKYKSIVIKLVNACSGYDNNPFRKGHLEWMLRNWNKQLTFRELKRILSVDYERF